MAKRMDLSGQKFGEWTVLEYVGNSTWKCRCSCGVEREVHGYSLRTGKSISCGHATNKAFKDLTGQQFGEWTVLEYLGDSMWRCRCSCGVEKNIHRYSLLTGGSKSCGHSTTGFKDLTGQHIGVYEVLKYLGNRKYSCRCECGAIDVVSTEYLNGTELVNECQHARNLMGKTFGELTVLRKGSPGKYVCRCSCGNEIETDRWSLEQGHTKSCGHVNAREKLEGKTFGEWEVLEYVGNQYYRCKCSCGAVKNVGAWLLKSGQSKSCGHSTVDFNDIVGTTIGPWRVLKYNGDYKYECECTCGKRLNILRYTLKHNTQKECAHQKIDCESLVGKRFGYWTVTSNIGKQMVACKCDCGTVRALNAQALLSGHSKSCGCMKSKLAQETLLKKYGDIATNKVNNPRDLWQIKTVHSKDALEAFMLRFITENGRKPTLAELSELLGIRDGNILKWVREYKLEDGIGKSSGSKAEREVADIVRDACDKYGYTVVTNDRSELGGMELDIYVPDLKLAIEFNGTFWHSDTMKKPNYHQQKTLDCISKGIRLIHIFEYEWNTEETKDRIIHYLKNIIGSKDNEVIYARDCSVDFVDRPTAFELMDKYHLQGAIGYKECYGLYQNDRLLGLMSFGVPRYTDKYEYEILRLCWVDGVRVTGGAEKLFKAFLRDKNPNSVVSYSDASKFTGSVYNRLGMQCEELTDPSYVWVNYSGDIKSRYQTMKQKLLDCGLGDFGSTEAEIMSNLGYVRVYNSGQYRYVYRV